jgi:hypothetical protein
MSALRPQLSDGKRNFYSSSEEDEDEEAQEALIEEAEDMSEECE